jgi:hypothetical protein
MSKAMFLVKHVGVGSSAEVLKGVDLTLPEGEL